MSQLFLAAVLLALPSACEPISGVVIGTPWDGEGGSAGMGQGGSGAISGQGGSAGMGQGGSGAISGEGGSAGMGQGGSGAISGQGWLSVGAGSAQPADRSDGCYLAHEDSSCQGPTCIVTLQSDIVCDGDMHAPSVAIKPSGRTLLAINTFNTPAPAYLFALQRGATAQAWAQPCGAGETRVVPGANAPQLLAHGVPGHGTVRCVEVSCPTCRLPGENYGARRGPSLPTNALIESALLDTNDRMHVISAADDALSLASEITPDDFTLALLGPGSDARLAMSPRGPVPFFFTTDTSWKLIAHKPADVVELFRDGTVRPGTRPSAAVFGADRPMAVVDGGNVSGMHLALQGEMGGVQRALIPFTEPDPHACRETFAAFESCPASNTCSEKVDIAGIPGLHALVKTQGRVLVIYAWQKLERTLTYSFEGGGFGPVPRCRVASKVEKRESYASVQTVKEDGTLGPPITISLGSFLPVDLEADAQGNHLAVSVLMHQDFGGSQILRNYVINAAQVAP